MVDFDYIQPKNSLKKFTINNSGLFLKKLNVIPFSKNYKFLFKLRKIYYTFIKPNQIKSTLLKRKTSIIFYKNLTSLNYDSNFYKLKGLNNFSLLLKLKLNKLLEAVKTNYTRCNSPFPTKNKINTTNLNSSLIKSKEVRLSRIKFKPGYSRLWRDARLAVKDLIGLKFIYQKQLTKYILRFYKNYSKGTFIGQELKLNKISIYSRIVPDDSTFQLLFNSNFVYVNGKLPIKNTIICVKNDFIQFIISK